MKSEDRPKPLPPKSKESTTVDVSSFIPEEPSAAPTGIPKSIPERHGDESPARARIRRMVESATSQILGITGNQRYLELEKRHRGLKWVGTHYVNLGRDAEERAEITEAIENAKKQ